MRTKINADGSCELLTDIYNVFEGEDLQKFNMLMALVNGYIVVIWRVQILFHEELRVQSSYFEKLYLMLIHVPLLPNPFFSCARIKKDYTSFIKIRRGKVH